MNTRTPFPGALCAAALISTLVGFAGVADAGPGPCAANQPIAGGASAQVAGFPATMHTGCTAGQVSGDAVSCALVTTNTNSLGNFFRAIWASGAARTNDSAGGCSFMCGTGDCRVGMNGLPVELLHFGVE